MHKEGQIKDADRNMKKHLFSKNMRKLSEENLHSNTDGMSPYQFQKQQIQEDIDEGLTKGDYSKL